MPSLSTFIPLLFAVSLFYRCWTENVTVLMNDTKLIWTQPSDSFPDCGGLRWLNETTPSVSMPFTGNAVSANFFHHATGASAQISLDDKNLTIVDAYQTPAEGGILNCMLFPWTSGALSPGNHTLKVTFVNKHIVDRYWLPIHSFVYSSLAGTTLDPNSRTPDSKFSNVGEIAGVVTGGVIALLFITVAFLIYRRRRQRYEVTVTSVRHAW